MFPFFRKLFGREIPKQPASQPRSVARCPDCGVAEGELHDLFCLKERCPFCGGQLASCECLGRVLQLRPEEQQIVDEYADDSVPPLSNIMTRWQEALARKGRVPYKASADTPYHAAYRGDLQAMKGFLADGFDVNKANEVGYTVVMAAARSSHVAMLRELLARGGNAKQADREGYTVLHWAVGQPVIDQAAPASCVKLLVEAGADPNAPAHDGITPLMNAAWFGLRNAASELLSNGADPSRKNNKGQTAQAMARQRGHHELAELLT